MAERTLCSLARQFLHPDEGIRYPVVKNVPRNDLSPTLRLPLLSCSMTQPSSRPPRHSLTGSSNMEEPLPAAPQLCFKESISRSPDKYESETLIALLDDPQTTEPESWTPIARAILISCRNQSQTMNIPMTPNILNKRAFLTGSV